VNGNPRVNPQVAAAGKRAAKPGGHVHVPRDHMEVLLQNKMDYGQRGTAAGNTPGTHAAGVDEEGCGRRAR